MSGEVEARARALRKQGTKIAAALDNAEFELEMAMDEAGRWMARWEKEADRAGELESRLEECLRMRHKLFKKVRDLMAEVRELKQTNP